MAWRRWWQWARRWLLALAVVIMLAPEWPAFGDQRTRLNALVGLRRFDFLSWEMTAVQQKLQAALANNHAFLDEATQVQTVLDTLAELQAVAELNAEIERLYSDPAIRDPDAAAAPLAARLAHQRRAVAARLPLAEAIVQSQVAWALRQEGWQVLGQAWPPVLMHMTPVPWLLVVSPRDHIERQYQVSLVHGLPISAHEALEAEVRASLDLSALVVPIGGLSTYPAMIMETGSIGWLVEVTAHEWTHHRLGLAPLGLRYNQDPQMRVINETVAALVDVEIRNRVLTRFYPDYLPPPAADSGPAPAPDPAAFDFRAEMAATRIRVDELLATGQVEAAEAYMEARRQVFVANGYRIRKLNQAYFAFHGAYAAEPGGATGDDPIGPMLRDIRAESGSLRRFLATVAGIRNYDDLLRIHGATTAASQPPINTRTGAGKG